MKTIQTIKTKSVVKKSKHTQDQLLKQLKISLKEKEVLLKEIHHRVKNNLQIISSLLSLQSLNITDEKTKEVFKESQNRIKSIALIHEKLYQSNNFAAVDFKSYINSLCEHLYRSYNVDQLKIILNTEIKDISLNIDEVIPCGLIINELVSNILKYAFPDNQKGEINIRLFKMDSKFNLSISDNGIGLPKSLDIEKLESLGLQLVMMLTRQLNGNIQITRDPGTKFEIIFTGIK